MAALPIPLYLVTVVAIVMIWRGVWGLLDEYLFPGRPKLSYWISLIVGLIAMTGVLSLLQL